VSLNPHLAKACQASLFLTMLLLAQVGLAQSPSNTANLLWDFTTFYDPSSMSHFASPLSDHDRVAIIEIVKRFTGNRGEVSISSSVAGSFTSQNSKQTLVYASQYDDRRSMVDGVWDFYVLFTQGHAQVIKGGVRSARGLTFLLRTLPSNPGHLDEILVYSAWFGMQEDIGHVSVMSFADSQPKILKQLGTAYESTCSSSFGTPATVASKIFLDDRQTLAIHREHYVRQCGDTKFRFLNSSPQGADEVLNALGKGKLKQ
jgi:hypothetical protein